MSDPIDMAISAEHSRQEVGYLEEQLRRQTGFELLSVFKGATCEAIDDAVERMMMLWRWYDPAPSRDTRRMAETGTGSVRSTSGAKSSKNNHQAD